MSLGQQWVLRHHSRNMCSKMHWCCITFSSSHSCRCHIGALFVSSCCSRHKRGEETLHCLCDIVALYLYQLEGCPTWSPNLQYCLFYSQLVGVLLPYEALFLVSDALYMLLVLSEQLLALVEVSDTLCF